MPFKERPIFPTEVSPEVYEERKAAVKSKIKHRYPEVLVLWCPNGYERPDIISTIVRSLDENVDLRARWVSTYENTRVWGGAVVEYEDKALAEAALKEILRTTPVLGINFRRFVSFLIYAEAANSGFNMRTMSIIIYCRRSLTFEAIDKMVTIIDTLGDVRHMEFILRDTGGVICTAEFRYASQAISAKILLNGMKFRDMGRITVETSDVQRENEIMDRTKHIMKDLRKGTFHGI